MSFTMTFGEAGWSVVVGAVCGFVAAFLLLALMLVVARAYNRLADSLARAKDRMVEELGRVHVRDRL